MTRKRLEHPQNHYASDTGFTLIEVLAGIIMATIFVLIASQAIAISAVYRVRAVRQSEALQAIQDDLANVKFAAAQDLPTGTCEPTIRNEGFAVALATQINGATDWSVNSFTTTNQDITLLNRVHRLDRTLSLRNGQPFNLMGISYAVVDVDPDSNEDIKTIAAFYTEVIPDEAVVCN